MPAEFHFLNVGDGDCTIIKFPSRTFQVSGQKIPSRTMMVDIHHHDEHEDYEDVINYYKNNFPGEELFRFISTHPHKDHLKGIKNLFNDSSFNVVNFWDLEHSFEPPQEGNGWEDYKEDWNEYQRLRKLNDNSGLCVRRYWDSQKGISFWDEDGITILSPSKELHEAAHKNEDGTKKDSANVNVHAMPYVLLIKINDRKILLAGDAEDTCWQYIVDNHKDAIKNVDILKAAHHGRLSGFHEEAVKIMNPKHIVFSIADETDQEHGADKEYKKAAPNATIHKTGTHGSIIAHCPYDESEINISKKSFYDFLTIRN